MKKFVLNVQTVAKIPAAGDDGYLRPTHGIISAIGILPFNDTRPLILINGDSENKSMKRGDLDYDIVYNDERGIIAKAVDMINTSGEIITFGGRTLDLPFLQFRAVVNGVILNRPLQYPRYQTGQGVDLLDHLTHFNAGKSSSLCDYLRELGYECPEIRSLSPTSDEYPIEMAKKLEGIGFLWQSCHRSFGHVSGW